MKEMSTPRHRRHDEDWTHPRLPAGIDDALVVVEPTISVSLRVEALHEWRDYGDAAEATPVRDLRWRKNLITDVSIGISEEIAHR